MDNSKEVLQLLYWAIGILAILIPAADKGLRWILRVVRRKDAISVDKELEQNNGDESYASDVRNRDLSHYTIDGKGDYGKGRLVLEVIKRYAAEHPNLTYGELEKVFSKQLRGVKNDRSYWGCVSLKADAVALYEDTGRKRHFLSDSDIIKLSDGHEAAVSSQWGRGNIDMFIGAARKLGFQIAKSNG